MDLSEIAVKLNLENINGKPIKENADIKHGYVCDLLSQVMATAKSNSIWITVQSHMNIVGVAVMTGIPAVIVAEGHMVASNVIEKADEEGVALFTSPETAFGLAVKLTELGVR